MRLGPGPVFAYEWLTTSRRWQFYALRVGFVGAILIGMMLVWHSSHGASGPPERVSIQTMARYAESLYETVVSFELTLILLAAPAATAGAICLDKARGTLDHMLGTDLSNAEIVLGKLAVRLVPVLSLIACLLPITALTSLLGGIDPLALAGSFLTAIACAVLGCSLALTLSVWGRKTHEVLMLTYFLLVVWLMIPVGVLLASEILGTLPFQGFDPIIWDWIKCSNPYFLVNAPYESPDKVGMTTFVSFFAACLALSSSLLALATLRIRGVALKQAGAGGRARSRAPRRPSRFRFPRLPGPSLDGNPVLWREWHRSRPTRFLRIVWTLYFALGILSLAASIRLIAMPMNNEELIAIMCTIQVWLGLLLLSANAATSLAEERVRGSLDVLLCTPLATASILAGKWWGSFRQSVHVVVWPIVIGGLLVGVSGRWIHYALMLGLMLSYCAGIASLGLALATWIGRIGRAVATCVSTIVVLSVGWLILVAVFFHPNADGLLFFSGSPLYGIPVATLNILRDQAASPDRPPHIAISTFFWTIVHGAIALLLFALTLATFDHCLGRISLDSKPTMRDPEKKPTLLTDPEFAVDV